MTKFGFVAAAAVLIGCLALLATPANAQKGGCVKKELIGFGSKSKTIDKINKIKSSGACLNICNKRPGCNSAVYFKSRKLCFLKAGTEATKDNNNDPRKALLFCGKTSNPVGTSGCVRKELVGFGSKSKTIKKLGKIKSTADCLNICNKNSRCNSAVYFELRKLCFLKAGTEATKDDNKDPTKALLFCDKNPVGVKCPAGQIKKEVRGFGSRSKTIKVISNIPNIDACLSECLKNKQCKSALLFKNKKCALKAGTLDAQENDNDPTKTLVACVDDDTIPKSEVCKTTFCECTLAQKLVCLRNAGRPFNFEKKAFCIRKRFDFTCAEVNVDVKVVDGVPSLFLGFGEFDSGAAEDADYQVCDQNNFGNVEANTFCKGLGFRSGVANGKTTEPSPQSQKAFFTCNGDGDLASCNIIALPKTWKCKQASFQCSTAGRDPKTGFPIADCRSGFVPVPFSLENGLRCVRAAA